jgi:hypothetical protein
MRHLVILLLGFDASSATVILSLQWIVVNINHDLVIDDYKPIRTAAKKIPNLTR